MVDHDLETPRESATVVIIRAIAHGFEVLMLQKHAAINYGGSWVFPGGIVEEQDHINAEQSLGASDRTSCSLAAVLRETVEETGLELSADQLQPFSNWLTPKIRIKRYNTLFFITELAADVAQSEIKIDGEEIVAARWISPTAAIAAQASGEMILNGPSFVTLAQLAKYSSTKAAVKGMTQDDITWYKPRGCKIDTGIATVYPGDVAYEHHELNAEVLRNIKGRKNRLYMHEQQPWEFVDSQD